MPASGLPTRFTKSLAGDAQSAIMPAALPMTPSFPFRARGSLWLFGAVAFLYLFSTSRERPWGDATPIWEVADSIAHSHNFHAKTRWPTTLPNGKDGNLYGLAPLFQCVVHVPGAYLQRTIASGVAKAVIDDFERIQIQHQHAEGLLMHVVFADRGLQRHLHEATIRQFREMVEKGQPMHRFHLASRLNFG